mgnify:CR=1 FL=1
MAIESWRRSAWSGLALGVLVVASSVLAQQPAASTPASSEEAAEGVPGRVIAVTAYRGQAMVTREVPVPEGLGLMDVVIRDLPNAVQPGSLFADGGVGVEVRAVRYRQSVDRQDHRGRVAELLERVERLDFELRENQSLSQLAAAQATYLGRLEAFATGGAQHSMAEGGMTVEALRDVTTFVFEQRSALVQRQRELAESRLEMERRRTDLQRELQLLGGGRVTMRREAVVFIEKTAAASSTLRLSYLVGNVQRRPTYNMRASSAADA